MATPLLRLSDGTTTLTFADEANYDRTNDDYFVVEDGFRYPPPAPQDQFAPSAQRDGAPLVNTVYPNTALTVLLKIKGASKPEMERNAAKIEDLLRTAREDALASSSPRVYLEYQVTAGVTRVSWDVLAGHLDLPDSAANTFQLQANQMRICALSLICKPFCRGYERALAKAQSAIPREDTDPATDEGIGIFGDAQNVCGNPVFYANVTDDGAHAWGNYTFAPDEWARYVNIKDSAGVLMPTCARFRSNLTNEGKKYVVTSGTLATSWTFSLYMRGRGTPRLIIDTDGTGSTGTTVTLTDNWTRYSVSATIAGGPTYVNANLINPDGTIIDCFVTKWMFARESFRSPFVPEPEYWSVDDPNPGTSGTGVIYQLAPGHTWDGTVHDSAASRSGVDAAGTRFQVPTTGLSLAAGVTFAAWVKSRGWAWDDGVEHAILLGGTKAAANSIYLYKRTDNRLALAVRDAYNLEKNRYSAAQTTAADTWVHVAFTLAADGTIACYLDGAAQASSGSDVGATGRVEYLPATFDLGSISDGTLIWQGFVQVQTVLPYAATAAQVTAMKDAGRQGNALGYIEANNGANFDGSNADANRGTATYTNLNGRIRLRDVQGQVPAPVWLRVYNNTSTAYLQLWLAHARTDGIPCGHIADLTPAGSGVSTADAAALGDVKSVIATMDTAVLQRIGTFTLVTDSRTRRYRVLLRAKATAANIWFTAELRQGTTFPYYSRRLVSPGSNIVFYDLGTVTLLPEYLLYDRRQGNSDTWSLFVGKATSGGLTVDYLIFLPVNEGSPYEVYWDDPLAGRWVDVSEPYLVVDTRDDRLLVMGLQTNLLTVSGYLGGMKGSVLRVLPGNSHLMVLGMPSNEWAWSYTHRLDALRYAPRYLVPPGL